MAEKKPTPAEQLAAEELGMKSSKDIPERIQDIVDECKKLCDLLRKRRNEAGKDRPKWSKFHRTFEFLKLAKEGAMDAIDAYKSKL